MLKAMAALLGVAGIMFGLYFGYLSLFPPEDAGVRAIITDANKDVADDASAVRSELQKADSAKEIKNADGTMNVDRWKQQHNPKAHHVAEVREARDEQIAIGRGEMLPHPPRYLNGYQHTWLSTGIPVYGCVNMKAAGQILRDPYTKAGPNGIDLAAISDRERDGFIQAHRYKTTLLKGVPWGAFLGKVCKDAEGKHCGGGFPIGENAYLSPDQVGSGHLWVIANGFVFEETGAGFLAGLPDMNLSDYNLYKGGFSFEQEQAPSYKCEPITTVAGR